MTQRVVMISGGSKGLGAGLVSAFLQRGDKVATFSRSSTPAVATWRKAYPDHFLFAEVDLIDSSACAAYLSQVNAFLQDGWEGRWFHRGFVDSGAPLAPDLIFLEPQVLPALAGILPDWQVHSILDVLRQRFETPMGVVSTVPVDAAPDVGGIDQPQVAGVWPVANAWVTAKAGAWYIRPRW